MDFRTLRLLNHHGIGASFSNEEIIKLMPKSINLNGNKGSLVIDYDKKSVMYKGDTIIYQEDYESLFTGLIDTCLWLIKNDLM